MTGQEAREFWMSLMDNASSLIVDAYLLLEADSFGRARSLMVLAQEELGKALWVYDMFEAAWSAGDESQRTVERLAADGNRHVAKYLEAMVFGDDLAQFWGDYTAFASPQGESVEEMLVRLRRDAEERAVRAKEAAREANRLKQRGFYVDRLENGSVASPTDIEPGTVAVDLQVAAQVVEMLLIKDHTRMQDLPGTLYDSTHAQQGRLLRISHPEDWAAASEQFRRSATDPPPTDA